MKIKETVVNCVLEERIKRNITQEDLSKILEVSRQTIISIEKGKYIPSMILGLKIAKFFKLRVEDIFKLKRNE